MALSFLFLTYISMSEKIIMDMKREIDAIINWIVDLKVQHLKDKIQEGYDAIAENKKLKDKEFKYKMQIENLQSYLRNTDELLKKLEEDKIIERFSDTDNDEEHWYYVNGFVYNRTKYEFVSESW